MIKKNSLLILIALIVNSTAYTQEQELVYNEFLGYVKKFHPIVKQANLGITEAQVLLLEAKGALDPKIEIDFNSKEYKDKKYYSLFNSTFKIPTWYGIELKAAFNDNQGAYLNPENVITNNQLTSVGISVPIGQGLWINQRMLDIKKARLTQNLNTAQRDLKAIEVIHQASLKYFDWKRRHDETKLYQDYLKNAIARFNAIKILIVQGDKPAIDSTEASIVVKNRQLSLEESKLKLTKARLELSNYLWTTNNIPLELQENIVPEKDLINTLEKTIIPNNLQDFKINNHPKIKSWDTKIDRLNLDYKFKKNALLPKINLSYNYISEPNYFTNYRLDDYKVAVNFAMPLFLRKERGALKLAQLKIQSSELARALETLELQNKITAQEQEILSLKKQLIYTSDLITDFKTMLNAEERFFEIGESSMFLINTRENALVTAQINEIIMRNNYFNSLINKYFVLGNFTP